MKHTIGKQSRNSGFTLIELLTVITIMAIVAGMVVGLAGVASKKKKVARTTAELNQLVTVIDEYFSEYGAYPPQEGTAYGRNSLYHELTGSVYTADPVTAANSTFASVDGRVTLTAGTISQFFGMPGFAHVGEQEAPKNFFPTLAAGQTALLKNGTDTARVLVVPAEAPPGKEIPGGGSGSTGYYAQDIEGKAKTVNPWRYNSSNPSNNPNTYDLWAEIQIGDETVIIGNWDN